MAVPLSLSVTIGNAILREVASRAAANVTMQMDMKASMKDRAGSKTGFDSSVDCRL